jgi:hypothetical protein
MLENPTLLIFQKFKREIDIDRVDNIVTYQLEHYKKI